jgi:hypothetical protein
MITLKELETIRDSLNELTVDVEEFSWGPSWGWADQRRADALYIINREIQARLQKQQQKKQKKNAVR